MNARPDGHGHVFQIGEREVKFDTIWDVYGEELMSVVLWTHDLTDLEVVAHARVYLEGPFADTFADPYTDFGVDPDETWPTATVSRVWAQWRPLTAEELDGGLFEEESDIRWVEEDGPREDLEPASVVVLTAR